MKSENWIIVELGAVLLILAVLSFFMIPKYEKGAWFAVNIFSSALSTVIGYKFGRSMPEQSGDAKPGQSSTVKTESTVSGPATTEPVVEPLPAPPAPVSPKGKW
jgi:hypothetical protein